MEEHSPWSGKLKTKSVFNRLRRYKGYSLPLDFARYEQIIDDFEIRDDDIWLCGFSKTGTTWCQEMVWCLANDFDYEKAKISLTERFPFFDYQLFFESRQLLERIIKLSGERTIDSIESQTDRRFIKSHLAFNFLPSALRERRTKAKIIYIMRDPKDTCISAYHFCRYVHGYEGTLEEFCDDFLNDRVVYTPMWEHILSYWNIRHTYGDQLFILTYEEMKENLPEVIRKMAKFLDKPELSTEEMTKLMEHLSFENIRKNPAVNNKDRIDSVNETLQFEKDGDTVRCGKISQWKTDMSPEIIKRFDERTARTFEGTGIPL